MGRRKRFKRPEQNGKIHRSKRLGCSADRANVDTDQIIPKQFLKSIKRTGFGPNLFDEWRYLDEGYPGQDNSKRPINPDFVLNAPRYQGAESIARQNFGCGSSREHAPWALQEYGFRAVICSSYADIFFKNTVFKNGVLPVLREAEMDVLFAECLASEGYQITVDLEQKKGHPRQWRKLQFRG